MSGISSDTPCSSNPDSGTTASLDCSSNPRHACEKLAFPLGMPQDENALSSSGRSMAPARPTTIQRQPGLHRPPCAAKRPSLWLLGRPLVPPPPRKPTSAAWPRTPARVPTSARAQLCQLSRECVQLADRPVGIGFTWSMVKTTPHSYVLLESSGNSVVGDCTFLGDCISDSWTVLCYCSQGPASRFCECGGRRFNGTTLLRCPGGHSGCRSDQRTGGQL